MTKQHLYTVILLASATALSCCGGSDGGVNSAATASPPAAPAAPSSPPPASTNITTFASPATRPGTYDTIAIVDRGGGTPGPSTHRLAAPGEIRISTYQSTSVPNELSYTLEFTSAELPANHSALTAIFPPQEIDTPVGKVTLKFGDQFTYTSGQITGRGSRVADGSSVASENLNADQKLESQLSYNAGLSHVSLGQWNWWVTDRHTGNSLEYNSVYFVHGDRTAVGDIPSSGTATYSGTSLGQIDVALTADFAQRSIAAQLSRDAQTWGDAIGGYTSVAAVDLHGTGGIASSGSFAVPLAGTVDTMPATGALDGAFFGPNAEQVGGVFAAGDGAGQALVRDAFVGLRN